MYNRGSDSGTGGGKMEEKSVFSNSSDGTAGEKKAKRLTPVATVERMEAKWRQNQSV